MLHPVALYLDSCNSPNSNFAVLLQLVFLVLTDLSRQAIKTLDQVGVSFDTGIRYNERYEGLDAVSSFTGFHTIAADITGGISIQIPKEAEAIIRILEDNGHEAFLVGGCVRDAMMGLTPKDYDICTSALPEQILRLFHKTIPTGLKHGTVTVIMNGTPFEVTTFRIDSEYSDHRRPDKVQFSGSLREDLKRRDFTINAMAFHPVKGIIDPFGGVQDIQDKIIRTVGDPSDRFHEDALRMLRTVRFKARFGFSIHEDTLKAMKILAETIRYVSRERVLSEMNAILLGPYPEEMHLLFETGLSAPLFPIPVPVVPNLSHLSQLPPKLSVRWAALFTQVGFTDIPQLQNLCRSFTMSTALTKEILAIANVLQKPLPKTAYTLRKAISEIGEEIISDAIAIAEASGASGCEAIRRKLENVTAEKPCIRLADLAINGEDLKGLGISPGKTLRSLLEVLFEMVLQKPQLNNRELLLEFARIIKKNRLSDESR